MPKENINNTPKTKDESLCDFHCSGLWSQCGADWSSVIQDEIQSTINQAIEKKEPKLTNKVVLVAVLSTLALLGAAMWISVSPIYQAGHESDHHSCSL